MLNIKKTLTKILGHAIMEQGTSGIWTYRKWADGTAECWGIDEYNTTGAVSWGGVYYQTPNRTLNFPSSLFTQTPSVCAFGITATGTQGWITTSNISKNAFVYYQVRGTSAYGLVTASVHAIGTWK